MKNDCGTGGRIAFLTFFLLLLVSGCSSESANPAVTNGPSSNNSEPPASGNNDKSKGKDIGANDGGTRLKDGIPSGDRASDREIQIAYCESYCARSSECGQDTDKQRCMDYCALTNEDFVPKLREGVVERVAQCFAATSCQTLKFKTVPDCLKKVAPAFSVTEKAKELCNEMDALPGSCTVDFSTPSACMNYMRVYTDETLEQTRACSQEQQCDAMLNCTLLALGVGGTGPHL